MAILIVDSSLHIVERLEEIIAEATAIAVVFTAISFAEAWQLYEDNRPEIVLLDIDLSNNQSYVLLVKMKEIHPGVVVIVLFNQSDDFIVGQYKAAGADFFLDKYHDYHKIPGMVAAMSGRTKRDIQPQKEKPKIKPGIHYL